MTSAQAFSRLRALEVPVVETAAAAAALGLSTDAAQKVLRRLADAGLVTRLFHRLWAVIASVDPLLLPDHLTAPLPSYVSLQSALYLHGLISQIPAITYAVSLSRTRRLATSAGTFSIHHIAPALFGGYEVGSTGVKLATPEKALFDVFYLSGKRTREFSTLPEVELPPQFRWKALDAWLERISFARDRTVVERRIADLRLVDQRSRSGVGWGQ